MRWLLLASLGSGRTVADSEIAISTTKHMAGTDAAPFLNYLRRLVSLNVLAVTVGLLAGSRLHGTWVSALIRSGEAFKKSVSLGAQLLLQPRRAVAIAAGPGLSAIEIAAVALVMRTHGGRVARRGLPADPEGYRPRARAVHLRLSWARIPQQRAALSPRLQPCCGAVRAIRYVRGHRIPSLA
jgi:hypothetical protein